MKSTVAFVGIKCAKYMGVVASVFTLACLQQNVALAEGKFTSTCENITLEGAGLEAVCKTTDQRNSNTGINLNGYITNRNGVLRWRRNGEFMNSSQNCDVEWHSGVSILHCDCLRRDGTWTGSTLNLDERIANINGALTYERPPAGLVFP